MSEGRSNRGRDDVRRQPGPIVPAAEPAHAALPARGTATAVASGAAGPPRQVLPYDRREARGDDRGDAGWRPDERATREPDGSSHGRGQPAHGQGDDIPRDLRKPQTLWVVLVLVGLAVLLAVLFAVGLVPQLHRNKELNADAKAVEEAPPTVNATRPQRARAVTELVLPGNVLAWQDTGIYARITGYVKKYHHDLGDYVKQGEPLAVIEAPDVDQQLAQAKAQLGQSQASLLKAQADRDLAKVTLDRFESLFKIKAINEQQLDQTRDAYYAAQSTLELTEATIKRDEANVRQFTEEQSWERVTAPFDGRITARNVNVGQLIMPGTTASNTGGGREMFHMAETDVVRVMITVPQTFVTWIRPDQDADVFFRDNPGNGIKGKVTRYSGSLDQTSRTLLTEVDVPNTNTDRPLTPGMYLQVKFSVRRNVPPLMVPESALIYNAQDTQLALVRQEADKATVHFQKITMGRDTGTEIEVIGGIGPDDVVVTNPGERLVDGGPVKVASIATPPPPDEKKQGPGELGTPGATPASGPAAPATHESAPGEAVPPAAPGIVVPAMILPPMTAPPGKPAPPVTLPATQPSITPTPPPLEPGTR